MSSSNQKTRQAEHELGGLLRYWRQRRGKSQLDLSLDSGISQRHISFVESGRSIPSRELLLSLSRTLDIPLRERNELFLASGYAPVYIKSGWDTPEMGIVRTAIDRVLRQHEPHPAVVMDRYWNILRTNEAAPRFFSLFLDLASRKGPRNILHLMLDPEGMRPFIENWEEVACDLLQRVYREAVGHAIDKKTMELLDSLKKYPGMKDLGLTRKGHLPVLPITFVKGTKRFSYFSMISTIGTPQCITAQEFRVECMFPAE
jgi:transcriptional regulator with XRE-family HTH domain